MSATSLPWSSLAWGLRRDGMLAWDLSFDISGPTLPYLGFHMGSRAWTPALMFMWQALYEQTISQLVLSLWDLVDSGPANRSGWLKAGPEWVARFWFGCSSWLPAPPLKGGHRFLQKRTKPSCHACHSGLTASQTSPDQLLLFGRSFRGFLFRIPSWQEELMHCFTHMKWGLPEEHGWAV